MSVQLDNASLQSLSALKAYHFNHDGIENSLLLVLDEIQGVPQLRIADLDTVGFWEKRRLRRAGSIERVASYVRAQLKAADKDSPWRNVHDRRLKRRLSWLSQNVAWFQNPLKEQIRIRIRWPSLEPSGMEIHEKVAVVKYEQLATIAKVRSLIEQQFRSLRSASIDAEYRLPSVCFQHVENSQDRQSYSRFLAEDGVRNAWRYLRQVPNGELHVDLDYDMPRLEHYMFVLGREDGHTAGYIEGRKHGEGQPPDELVDLQRAKVDHFGLDNYYEGFENGYDLGYRGGRMAWHRVEDTCGCLPWKKKRR